MLKLSRLAFYILIPLIVGVMTYRYLSAIVFDPANSQDTKSYLVEIPHGLGVKEIGNRLSKAGVIRSPLGFSLLAKLRGKAGLIHAGEFELQPSMSPKDILEKMVRGEVYLRKVTFREGLPIWQYGALLESAGIISTEEFNPALSDKNLLIKAGINAESFEGYLFPETYTFAKPITPRNIIWKMLEEGEARWTTEIARKAGEMGMTRGDVLTLASIVEKESGNAAEQPRIASVFHNRLKIGMRLQSDPTVIYGIESFDGNLTRVHLETDHPYNTYTRAGLPPGPICNPGASAIHAAVFPEESNYLYFVADGLGGHVFSRTLEDHINNVNKYQRGGR